MVPSVEPNSTSLAPDASMHRSYQYLCRLCMSISFLIPVVSGSRWMLSSSSPAMQAAAARVSADPAPDVTYAAGTSAISAITAPAFSSSSIRGM